MSNFNSADIAAFKDVWVFCEQREGKLMPTDFELISKGRDLANELGVNLCGLLLGGEGIESVAKELGGYGADKVIVCESPLLSVYNTDAYAKVICDVIEEMKPLLSKTKWCEMVLCVPFTDIQAAVKAAKGSKIAIGAENMHFEKSGAFTGEISADMLKELGVKYVIVGHSERRQYFNETDETCNKKVKAAIENGLRPILCVGESLAEREQDVTMEVIRKQVKIALQGVAAEDIKKVVIAYEPIWAIGTGKTATADQANEVCALIRATVEKLYDKEAADALTIQYGGSMNAGNAAELLSKPDVDGGLIGGASLKAPDFATIINAASK